MANAELQNDELEQFIATTKDWKCRKALAEQGLPWDWIPDDFGLKELMER